MHNATELKTLFEEYLQKEQFTNKPKNLYEPINYILQLGGKRFRPILVLLAYEMFQEKVESVLSLALSIEMFHNFSLVHDDIMDEANLRRGQATVHRKYGTNTGILAGDLMLIYCYQFIIQNEFDNKDQILKVFNQMCIDVCEGQHLDMEFEEELEITIPEYLEMIEKKTSVLIGAALQIGALAGSASEKDAFHLYQYGKNLGIAFQIQDDVLDVFGSPEKFGKKWGGDIIQGKKTYLYLKSKELLHKGQQKEFDKIYMSQNIEVDEKIRQVKKIFEELNVLEYARQTQEAYAQLSESHLDNVNIPIEKKQNLINMSRRLFEREI
jgi:geranylgeranyl diphosphate synthase type II